MIRSLYYILLCLLVPVGFALAEGVPSTGPNSFQTSTALTTSGQILSGPGYIHALVCIGNDAAAQAATITLYDNTAGSGTVVGLPWNVQAVAYTYPVIFPIKRVMTIGAYLLYSATADITCYTLKK